MILWMKRVEESSCILCYRGVCINGDIGRVGNWLPDDSIHG
ncbi:hypothetical protein B488_04980 [Liberibacter crescens BT-1]|uniref:Uncharacterized protein n=1 Tax=Liberibacter crescens (strain BT-1) TaxID=1215343 RepID=L0EUG4_LIBCB|nr:hypothetical protein B488_04980 [Liberibacter crescens BT-1]